LKFISIRENLDTKRDFPEILKIAAKICNIPEDEFNKNITVPQDPMKVLWKQFQKDKDPHGIVARKDLFDRKKIDIYDSKFSNIEWGVSKFDGDWHIAIPMRDVDGKIIGFQRACKRMVKDSSLGFFFENLDKRKPVYLVEGFTDYLSMIQMGYSNVIGLASATVKTEKIVELLSKFKKSIMILDSDIYKDERGSMSGSGVGAKKSLSIKNKMGSKTDCYFLSVEKKIDINDVLYGGGAIKKYLVPSNMHTCRQLMNLIPDKVTMDNAYIADQFLLHHDVAFASRTWWRYEEPIWDRVSEERMYNMIQKFIEDEITTLHTPEKIRKTFFYIKNNCFHHSEPLEKAINGDQSVPRNFIFLKNGKYDLKTGNVLNYSPTDYVISTLDVSFTKKDSDCPRFMKFLSEIFDGDEDIDERINFIQEWFGYALYPHIPFQKILFILGSGANGKGTMLNVLENIVGRKNYVNLDVSRLERNQFSTQSLLGTYVNIVPDAERSTNLSAPIVKSLTGGDSITGERKYENLFVFRPFAKMIFAANSDPVARDAGNWLLRRLHMIRFNNEFASMENYGNVNLANEILEEKEKVFWWAIEGLERLLKKGFTLPKSVAETTAKFVTSSDYLVEFVKNVLNKTISIHKPMMSIEDSYDEFKKYCIDDMNIDRRYILSKPYFLKRMEKFKQFEIDETHIKLRPKES
jgi:P4 family phage/plasmid primase-like protien